MHYHAELWIPGETAPEDLRSLIDAAMGPHSEHTSEDGWWDWWQIGGRYTGRHDPAYDPQEDPRNVEDCDTCGGSGFRRDGIGNDARDKMPSYTCNACGVFDSGTQSWGHGKYGPGKRIKWPTQWALADCDIMPVADCPADLKAWTLLVNGQVFHHEEWNGEDWVDGGFDGNVIAKLKELGITDGYLLTLDYHS